MGRRSTEGGMGGGGDCIIYKYITSVAFALHRLRLKHRDLKRTDYGPYR